MMNHDPDHPGMPVTEPPYLCSQVHPMVPLWATRDGPALSPNPLNGVQVSSMTIARLDGMPPGRRHP
jgi:hypothetical protein